MAFSHILLINGEIHTGFIQIQQMPVMYILQQTRFFRNEGVCKDLIQVKQRQLGKRNIKEHRNA